MNKGGNKGSDGKEEDEGKEDEQNNDDDEFDATYELIQVHDRSKIEVIILLFPLLLFLFLLLLFYFIFIIVSFEFLCHQHSQLPMNQLKLVNVEMNEYTMKEHSSQSLLEVLRYVMKLTYDDGISFKLCEFLIIIISTFNLILSLFNGLSTIIIIIIIIIIPEFSDEHTGALTRWFCFILMKAIHNSNNNNNNNKKKKNMSHNNKNNNITPDNYGGMSPHLLCYLLAKHLEGTSINNKWVSQHFEVGVWWRGS